MVLGFMLIIRLLAPIRFLLLILALIAAGGYVLYLLWSWLEEERQKHRFRRSVEGVIQARMTYCQEQVLRNEEEMRDIRSNISELEDQLKPGLSAIAKQNAAATQQLIADFSRELQLRETKISFYETCIEKLRILLHNYNLSRILIEKREKLEQLKENHRREVNSMKVLQSDVAFDHQSLDLLSDLSSRMLSSTNLQEAVQLNLELERMTRQIENL